MFVGAAAEVGGEDVTLVKGSSVCVGDASGRFPEMFTGFDRRDFPGPSLIPRRARRRPGPRPHPCRCWAACFASTPDLPRGEGSVAPALPRSILTLRVSNVPLADSHLTVAARPDTATIDGVPEGVKAVYPHSR
ncbi:MAG: hypothetical protein QOK30_1245 [Nocardioidaceae bacterium]|jgi:hypothetical protein|nr:hypothetical protein [Nocardioidaceae bacterium]